MANFSPGLLQPWLAELVRRADAEEAIDDTIDFSQAPDDISEQQKIEALADIICRAGDEAGTKSAALLVLMSTLENTTLWKPTLRVKQSTLK